MAQFFEPICTSIFKQFLVTEFIKKRLFRPLLTYYNIIEINS